MASQSEHWSTARGEIPTSGQLETVLTGGEIFTSSSSKVPLLVGESGPI